MKTVGLKILTGKTAAVLSDQTDFANITQKAKIPYLTRKPLFAWQKSYANVAVWCLAKTVQDIKTKRNA